MVPRSTIYRILFGNIFEFEPTIKYTYINVNILTKDFEKNVHLIYLNGNFNSNPT